MRLIRSIMGRRQFLIGAAGTGALGLVSRKLAGAFEPGREPGVAMASETPDETSAKAPPGGRYPHLLSPLKIGNVILKNRMLYTVSNPHFLQGPETYPADEIRAYFANIARSAAIVTCRIKGGRGMPRKDRTGDSAHMMIFDESDPAVQNYIDQMVEGVHCMGSLVCVGGVGGSSIEETVAQAKQYEAYGVDIIYMGASGGLQDKKTARAAMEEMQAVKNATGLLIGINMTIIEPSIRPETGDAHISGHYTIPEAIEVAKSFEGTADMLYFRASSGMANHPIGFNQADGADPLVLNIARAIKESGAKIVVAPNGGFRNPAKNDRYIADGKTDMIAMARSLIADPDYGDKLYEGRAEDLVPCIMCNKCHGLSMLGPWFSVCTVNPKLGIPSAIRAIKPPTARKKVAVIGGGPAGMTAAITAAERGHQVTLYEKSDALGGLLRHTDHSPFKWPLREYKDYLVRQTLKAGVQVLLNSEATPEIIGAKGYEVVLAAVGAAPAVPRIPGSDGDNVFDIVSVYGNEKALGKRVVFIGSGEFGVETAIFLADAGHQVTMLTSGKELLHLDRVHYPEIIMDTYEHMDNFDYITEAIPTGISKGKVAYTDASGGRKTLQADSVVIYTGLKASQEEALKFSGAATGAFFPIGDCTGRGGDVQKAVRNAFFMASQV